MYTVIDNCIKQVDELSNCYDIEVTGQQYRGDKVVCPVTAYNWLVKNLSTYDRFSCCDYKEKTTPVGFTPQLLNKGKPFNVEWLSGLENSIEGLNLFIIKRFFVDDSSCYKLYILRHKSHGTMLILTTKNSMVSLYYLSSAIIDPFSEDMEETITKLKKVLVPFRHIGKCKFRQLLNYFLMVGC